MIRINLLPQARKQATARASAGAQGLWAAVYLIGMVVWCVVLVVVYFIYDGKLDEQLGRNRALEKQIATVSEKSAQLEEVEKKLAVSKELEAVVTELARARTGPSRVLRELNSILSAGGGPTIDPDRLEAMRRENPLAGYNRSWDVRRLWLSQFLEDSRRVIIKGMGKTNEDVAELLRRLALSDLFEEVTLTKTELAEVDEVPFIGFELSCRVKY